MLANAQCQSPNQLTDPTPSRASPLPHGLCGAHRGCTHSTTVEPEISAYLVASGLAPRWAAKRPQNGHPVLTEAPRRPQWGCYAAQRGASPLATESRSARYRGCTHSNARSTTSFAIPTKCITARCCTLIASADACADSTAQCSKSAAWARASSKLRLSFRVKVGASGEEALR